MAWDGDWKHLAPLCYVCMNDGIGFYIWGLGREVWEGKMLFTAIALAFCEVEICRPPWKCSFTTCFCVFYPLLCAFIASVFLLVLLFPPAPSSSPFTLTLPEVSKLILDNIKCSVPNRTCQLPGVAVLIYEAESVTLSVASLKSPSVRRKWGLSEPSSCLGSQRPVSPESLTLTWPFCLSRLPPGQQPDKAKM